MLRHNPSFCCLTGSRDVATIYLPGTQRNLGMLLAMGLHLHKTLK